MTYPTPMDIAEAEDREADASGDRDVLYDLLARAYVKLMAFGAHNSSNMETVLLMDEIKLELLLAPASVKVTP